MDASRKRSVGLSIGLVAATVVWLALTRFGPDPSAELIGRRPNLEVLAPYKGKVTLVNLFATWCGPCIFEMPDLDKLQAAHPTDLAVVGLQVDDKGGTPLPAFAQRVGVTYTLIDANDNPDVEREFGAIEVLPVSILIDRSGAIVGARTGGTTLAEFERWVAPFLN